MNTIRSALAISYILSQMAYKLKRREKKQFFIFRFFTSSTNFLLLYCPSITVFQLLCIKSVVYDELSYKPKNDDFFFLCVAYGLYVGVVITSLFRRRLRKRNLLFSIRHAGFLTSRATFFSASLSI